MAFITYPLNVWYCAAVPPSIFIVFNGYRVSVREDESSSNGSWWWLHNNVNDFYLMPQTSIL